MSTMQMFYEQLRSTKPADDYQRALSQLTRASREQVLKLASSLTWYIWDAQGVN